jgi:hypothetical protein
MGLIKRDGNVIGEGLPPKHRICVICFREPVDMSYGLAFEDGTRRIARRLCKGCVHAIQAGLETQLVETKYLYRMLEEVTESPES